MDGCRHCTPCALDRIESALARMESRMASIDQVLKNISAGVTDLEGDVNRLISTLGELSPEQQAAADSLLTRLGKLNEQADAAVPEKPLAASGTDRPSAGEDGHPVPDATGSGVADAEEGDAKPTAETGKA